MWLAGLAAVAFVLAIIGAVNGPVVTIPAEAFSRASSNLALLAIALVLLARTPGGSAAAGQG
jgi:hypothetical protein